MGCGGSKDKTLEGGSNKSHRKKSPQGYAEPLEETIPDPGLWSTHKAVKSLGKGGTGETWLYKNRLTGEEVAVKLMRRPLPRIIEPNIQREIRIQADLGEGHINIVNAKEALLTEFHLALVLEYASAGTLTGYVAERWHHGQTHGVFLTEDEARYFFRQFINAVDYCHEHFVAHRDLKLDNTLLSGGDPPIVKLCDFGFAKDWEGAQANMATHIGTPVYMPPEMLNSNGKGYDGKSVDIWASGVLLIVMLLGQFPFDHVENPDPNSDQAHLEVWQQQMTHYREHANIKPLVSKLSKEVLDLLDNIFVISAEKRITIEQIKKHPWFTKALPGKYAAAEQKALAEQAKVNARLNSRAINTDLLLARNKALYDMISQACTKAEVGVKPATAPLLRVDLAEDSIMEKTDGMATIADTVEEEG